MIGRLGAVGITFGNTVTNVYTVPAGKQASVNVSLCNRLASAVNIRLAISNTSGAQGVDEYLEYDYLLPAKTAMERTGLALDAGMIVTVYASTDNAISAVVTGAEEAI